MSNHVHSKRKRAALLLLILVVCWSLGACGDPDTDLPAAETTEPSATGAIFDGSLELGDTIPDLTVTTAEGQFVSLSQLLKKKKLVVLNFWFANCGWCLKEFPAMEVAYQSGKTDVEILALNPVDAASDVSVFRENHSFSFPMAACSRSLSLSFGVNSYPTSVFIDRNGTICLIHTGAITDVATFRTVFEAFTADDYQQKLYAGGISELLEGA